MELVYVWIEKFRNIKEQGFNLSSYANVEFVNLTYNKRGNITSGELKLEQNRSCIDNYLPSQITQITAITGPNGSGKTNFIDFLYFLEELTKETLPESKVIVIFRSEGRTRQNRNFAKGYHLHYNFTLKYDSTFFVGADSFKNLLHGQQNKESLFFRYGLLLARYSNLSEGKFKQPSALLSKRLNLPALPSLTFDELMAQAGDVYNFELDEKERYVHFLADEKLSDELPFATPDYLVVQIARHIPLPIISVQNREFFDCLQEIWHKQQSNKFFKLLKLNVFISFVNFVFLENQKIDKTRNLTLLSIIQETITLDIDSAFLHLIKTLEKIYNTEHWIVRQAQNLLNLVDWTENKLSNRVREGEMFLNFRNELPLIQELLKLYRIAQTQLPLYQSAIQRVLQFELIDRLIKGYEPYIFSSGEKAMLSFLSRIYYFVHVSQVFVQNYFLKEILLLIDEADLGMHMRWQQNYVKTLITILPRLFTFISPHGQNTRSQLQIILTTHSPMPVSDLPRHNQLFLDKSPSGECIVKDSGSQQHTLGANIFTILQDSFMMDGFMGKFAAQKISELIRFLNGDPSIIQSYDEAQKMVNMLGEPIVRKQMQELINNRTMSRMEELDMLTKTVQLLQERISNMQTD